MYRYITVFLLLFNLVFAYVDEDLDGVDDAVDKCPGTPFDVLVNADGCPLEEKGNYYLKLSSSFSSDKGNSSLVSYLTLAYANQNWYFSITGSYILDGYSSEKDVGDTYIFGSYIFPFKNVYTQLGLNIKLPTSESSKNLDYTPSILIDVFFDPYDVFFYGNYTITEEENLKNSYSFSVGFGQQLLDTVYYSFSFDYSQANVSNQDDEYYITGYIIYDITRDYYISILYSQGINKDAVDYTIFGKVGVRF